MEQILEHPGWASFWRWVVGTVVTPRRTLREVIMADAWPQALALILAVAALQAILRLGELAIQVVAFSGGGTGVGITPLWALGATSPLAASSGSLGALTSIPAAWTAASLIYYLIAMLLGGRGSFTGLWAALGFASLPALLLAPVTVPLWLAAMLGPLPAIVVGLLAIVVAIPMVIWSIALQAIAVREAMSLGSGRAALTILIPVGALLVLALLIGCALLVVLIAVHAGQMSPGPQPSV